MPVAVRRGLARNERETSAWTSTRIERDPSIVAATTGHKDVVTVLVDGVSLARVTITGASRARGIFNQTGAGLTIDHTTSGVCWGEAC